MKVQISSLEQQATTGAIDETAKLNGINAVISSIDSGQKLGLLLFMILVPLVCLLISYFVYQKKYHLDENEYQRICDEINQRKETNN